MKLITVDFGKGLEHIKTIAAKDVELVNENYSGNKTIKTSLDNALKIKKQ